MDRTYLDEVGCGEVRLIYRLTRTGGAFEEGAARLPVTLNLVLRAKGDRASEMKITCAEIARRWLASGSESATGAELAAKLSAKDGPLDLIEPENLDLIETNLQIAHAPKSAVRDFRTDYLLKVFRYETATRSFEESPLENQIDRDRILADENLKRDFKAWVLHPRHFAQLDSGTLLLPEQFLAKGAIATTPVGFAPSNLLPTFGLTEGEGAGPVFTENDVVMALKKAASSGVTLQNIRSVGGFERRLNDLTCSGCHQTRGIGGFHFPGVDWMAQKPSNSTVVPASPHFFGDQVRRRDILDALASGRQPRLFPRLFQPPAIARQHRTRRQRIQRRLGCALLSAARQASRQRRQFPFLDLRQRARLPGERREPHGDVLRQKPVICHRSMLDCGRHRPQQRTRGFGR